MPTLWVQSLKTQHNSYLSLFYEHGFQILINEFAFCISLKIPRNYPTTVMRSGVVLNNTAEK
jgi:hypothetical protein